MLLDQPNFGSLRALFANDISYDQRKINTKGKKLDVYESVGNQYKMSDNRESHFQTLIAQNNALIEPVCRKIKNPRKKEHTR